METKTETVTLSVSLRKLEILISVNEETSLITKYPPRLNIELKADDNTLSNGLSADTIVLIVFGLIEKSRSLDDSNKNCSLTSVYVVMFL